MKKLISLIICITVVLACAVPAFSATPVTAKVYNVYQNNMLFEQNEDDVVAGTAQSGNVISCYLYDKSNNLITSSEAVAENDSFSVIFKAPKGAFEEYTLVLKENGMTFTTLTGIVFGELWLASGQSNMELNMDLCSTWDEFKKAGYGSPWVRALSMYSFPDFGDDSETSIPLYPQSSMPDGEWVRGCDAKISHASAVAVYFAHKLMDEINVPVGVLNSSLGGSRIESWLSRETIENDERALSIAKAHGTYWTDDTWVDHELSDVNSLVGDYTGKMATNFNARVYSLRNFRISGMIWYQGEANMGYEISDYQHLLGLLQKQNGELFSYKKGNLPIIYSQLASFDYNTTKSMQYFNYGFSEFQKQDPESRACISIYDLPLTFKKNYSTIHPLDKQPIGERMAENAAVMVYGKEGVYSAPTFTSARIKENEVIVKLDNVGDGIIAVGGNVKGFALCGADGVYYRAEAKIVDKDTVRVYSDSVKAPVCVTYAYSYQNDRANLYSSYHATVGMPVTPFISNFDYDNENAICNSDWQDCDIEQQWNMAFNAERTSDALSGFYDVWNTKLCSKKIVSLGQYTFDKALNLKSLSKYFSVDHNFTYKKYNTDEVFFTNQDTDWSKYGCLNFLVRNNGKNDVIIENKITTGNSRYSAAINGTVSDKYVIPADGQWHKVELNFSALYNSGDKSQIADASVLKDVRSFRVSFNSKGIYSNVDVDEFNFAPETVLNDNTSEVSRTFSMMIIDLLRTVFKLDI